ncbi:transposase [Nonomuraea insulae]|uniref:Transposase n=1 Tax=Nonomuraea insulae TaxID=1616787 RepID=A0ABW1CRU3_9ACTN
MLPDGTLPSLAALLAVFRSCFTAPGHRSFAALVVGLIAQTRRRTVCGMLLGAGLERAWHHCRAHRFFSTARWCTDALGLVLGDLVVARLLAPGSAIIVVVDDTLFKRSGKKVFGVAWHHDGAAKGPKPIGFGNCWVIAGIIVQLPFLSRPLCLPVLARLWRPGHTGKIAFAQEMVEAIATRHPTRMVHAVGDAAYAGEHLRGLDDAITWTSRLKVTSVLHALPPPRTGRSGRPRTKGARLGTPADLAAAGSWRTTRVRRYGRTDIVHLTETVCLWYGPFRSQSIRVILVRDTQPRTRDGDDRGYGLPLITTDLLSSAEDLIARYAARWCIEVAFFDARQSLGVGQARNRTRLAVERTVPFGMICLSVTILWYATSGHSPADTAERRARSRWCTTKTEPSFEDMVIKLRRVIIAERFRPQAPYQATPEETQAVLAAWAAAET